MGARTGLVLRFGLEGGAYATMAIRELMKTGTGYNAHYANMMKGAPKSTSGAPKFASSARLRARAHGNALARTQRGQRTRRACASSAGLPPAAALRLVPSPARLCCLIFLFVGARACALSLSRARAQSSRVRYLELRRASVAAAASARDQRRALTNRNSCTWTRWTSCTW